MTSDRPPALPETPAGPLVHYANLVSDLAVDPEEREVLRAWAEQAPREVWLLRPGDVLLSPVPVDEAFLRYACGLTGVPRASVTVLARPDAFAGPGRRAPYRGAADAVRGATGGRPVGAVLPTALDGAAVGLARELGVPVAPYASAEEAGAALDVARWLNTKAGFREAARALGMRLPDGRVRRRDEVASAVKELLASYEQVVVKPDRSAGGHGLLFLTAAGPRTDEPWATESRAAESRAADVWTAGSWTADGLVPAGGAEGLWVVEERIGVTRSVSVQMETGPRGTRALFSGEMRTVDGSFTGYLSPLPDPVAAIGPTLGAWGRSLGDFLAERGYAGPFGIDAMVSADGEVYAGESNVRRTATTTPRAMAVRLAARAGTGDPVWATGRARSRGLGFDGAVRRLRADRIAYDPARGEGVVLYAGPPPDGETWRYAVIAGDHARVARYEELLRSSWERAA